MDTFDELLSGQERSLYSLGSYGKSVGFGKRPALLVIDAQKYMVAQPSADYPSGCGDMAKRALPGIQNVIQASRNASVPIFYTQLTYRRDGADLGIMAIKRGFDDPVDGWCFEGSTGVQIVPEVAPMAGDIVLRKTRASAFFGTPLVGILISLSVDTLLIVGGSTSNCVRATVVDASSFGYRVSMIADCIFDRFEISHQTALLDLQRVHADVVSEQAVHRYLDTIRSRQSSPRNDM